MALRRNKSTPYEVMRLESRPGPSAGRTPPRQPDPGRDREPPDPGNANHGWLGAGSPIVLRVPRGVAIIAILTILGLILSAYFVGQMQTPEPEDGDARGQTAGLRSPPPGAGNASNQDRSDQQGGDPAAAAPDDDSAASSSPLDDPGRLHPQRQDGFGYLIIATYPHEEARRLQAFLDERGVATALEPDHNNRSRSRVRCMRGLAFDEKDARAAFAAGIFKHGQAWWRHNGNRGHDLSDYYWSPY